MPCVMAVLDCKVHACIIQGIWLARSSKISDPTTFVMDLEGSDGRERGEDDTNFERQSALFALAVADVLLVNIWCHDIGREHGSGKPLLKTIFQVRRSSHGLRTGRPSTTVTSPHHRHHPRATPHIHSPLPCAQVNLKLFAPEPNRHRTVLLFVLRDKTKTPLPRLVETLEGDLNSMWAAISKPTQYNDSKMSDFFDIQYAGLSHFEEK